MTDRGTPAHEDFSTPRSVLPGIAAHRTAPPSHASPPAEDQAPEREPTVGRRRQLVRAIVAWIDGRERFTFDEVRAAFSDVPECEFGPALNRAKDEWLNRGVPYGPVRGEPGAFAIIDDDARKIRRSLRFAARGRKTIRRAAAIADCAVRPEHLPPVLAKAHEASTEHAGIHEASRAAKAARRKLPGC